jgi:hypothetical protein
MPSAGPSLAPKSITEFASPRRCSGTTAATVREVAGYATASPTPSSSRMQSSAENVETAAVDNVATDQSRKPAA